MTKPLVSIVTPSYNQAAFLEDTVQSVFAQDYPEMEYIIVDGGSTDGSVEIIRKYQSQLTWWVSEADEGQASAINKGMAHAKGDIVAWLNSDDIYLPGAIEGAVASFQANPKAQFVFGNAITIDAKGRPLNKLVFPEWELADLVGFRIICQPAVFMRRQAYNEVKGLNPQFHFMLDHQLWIRIASLGEIKHEPAFWAAARHHEAAKNVSQATAFGRETLEVLDWMKSEEYLNRLVVKNKRKVYAGAYRLNARYLLDGGEYKAALKSYIQAFLHQPGYTIRHWHRILYACLGILNFRNLDSLYFHYQQSRRPDLREVDELNSWPGISLEISK